jgi:integrase
VHFDGEVPSIQKASKIAQAMLAYYPLGDLLVELDAVTGLRIGELLATTFCDQCAPRRTSTGSTSRPGGFHVRFLIDGTAPKRAKRRSVKIPHVDRVPTGFDLRAKLTALRDSVLATHRCADRKDRSAARVFPTVTGKIPTRTTYAQEHGTLR